MKKLKTYTFIIALLLGGNLMAQNAQMNVRSQQTAYVGQAFRIVFEVNDKAQNFQMPTLKGIKLVGGPSISSNQSLQIINGTATHSTSTNYTIIVQADAEGTANVGVASCMVDGKKVQSRPFSIKINKADPNRQQQQRRRSAWPGWDEPQQQQQQSAPQLDDKSLIARISINKSNLYQGEEAIISYKIYTQVQLAQYQIDQLPRIKGFWSEDLSENWTHVRQYEESYNGRNYHVAEIRRGAIYPQETGTLKIDPLKTDVVAIVQSRMQRTGTIFDFFIDDPFFSPMQQQAITKSLVSNAPTVQVKPLPEAPEGFAGGVGRFDVKAKSDLTELRTNEALTYRVTVSGRGNLSLLEVPQIEFPQGLEVYEPRIEDNINKGDNGLNGSRTFEWIIIPQTQGEYDIPALDYVYFDPASGQYVTRHCDPIHLKVAKGSGNTTSKSDVKELNSDIHHIKKESRLRDQGSSAQAGWLFWLLIVLSTLGTSVVVFWMRHQQKIAGDEGSMKLQRATKLAKKRLRNAERYLNAGDDERFYEEIYKALWGCIADKFNIQLSLLSSETVKSQLEQKQVNKELEERIMQTLADVDFARFAPGDSSAKKQTIYEEAMNTIMQIGAIKISAPHRGKSNAALTLFALLAATLPMQAQNNESSTPKQLFNQGNEYYEQGDYTAAVELYNAILANGQESWEVYYNLGNAYYRLDEMGKSILNYERARQLAPHKREIKDNLALARTKTEDHIEDLPHMFLIEWFHSIVGWMSPKGWRTVFVVLWILLCITAGIFLVSQAHITRKTSFITMVILALLIIFSIINTTFSTRDVSHSHRAVVTAPMVVVKGSPDSKSVDKFVLHEGTCMTITDQQDEWWQIEIGDGKNGWISSGAERI